MASTASTAGAASLYALFLEARGIPVHVNGLIGSMFAMGVALGAVGAGMACRRAGLATVLKLSMLAQAGVVAVFAFLPGSVAFGVARVVEGVAVAGFLVASESWLMECAPTNQAGRQMAIYTVVVALANVVGPGLATVVVGQVGMGLSLTIIGGLAASGLVFAPPHVARTQTGEGASSSLTEWPLRQLWKSILVPTLSTLAFGFFQAAVLLVLPLFLTQVRGMSTQAAVSAPAFFGLGLMAGAPYVGRLGDRWGHTSVMRGLVVVGLVALGLALLAPSPWWLAPPIALAGATLGCLSPLALALVAQRVPASQRSAANALYNAHYALGMLLGPPVCGTLYQWAGPWWAWGMLGLVWLGLLMVLVGERGSRRP